MGVTGLWQILHPCARPIKLETLNRKRLAVDASIWIYQFLKAVRDKEGNALRNSHVVGFFRRICKLLFFGIKPVFVFDGGAPVLKRQTVTDRKKKREGRREDAVRTAGKLLAVQMQRRAEEEEQRRKEDNRQATEYEETVPDDALVYVDEIGMSQKERQQSRRFKKKDAYHLPELDMSMNEMGGPDDPRIMSLEELQAYARQFQTGEDVNVYDFSKIDYDSSFFMSLPASDRYNILNAARLRSRLRMGHSKEQLDTMFPDRMAFSKFQIERVTERNELTQRLMHLNETGDALFNGGGRVAGEKGREYVLVKNDGVEGGWALGVISDEGTKRETAIDVDKPALLTKQDDDWEDEDEFEDVPIEGLNRLPKVRKSDTEPNETFAAQRRHLNKSGKPRRRRKAKAVADPDSLFVADEPMEDVDEEWEDAGVEQDGFGESNGHAEAEDEDLRRAIAMSLEQTDEAQGDDAGPSSDGEDDMLKVFQQSAAPEAAPLPKGSGRAIANIVNKRAFNAAPESREVTSFGVPRLLDDENDLQVDDNDDEEDMLDLQAALAESRRTKRKTNPAPQRQRHASPPMPAAASSSEIAKKAGFSGPLPFEKLNLGTSLLGQKKMQERSEEAAGGFINPEIAEEKRKKDAEPLPPWFSGDLEEGLRKQRAVEKEDLEKARTSRRQFHFDDEGQDSLMRDSQEIIDLDAEDDAPPFKVGDVIDLEAEDDVSQLVVNDDQTDSPNVRMDDLAETMVAQPPITEEKNFPNGDADPDTEMLAKEVGAATSNHHSAAKADSWPPPQPSDDISKGEAEDEQPLDWSDSEHEHEQSQFPMIDQHKEHTSQGIDRQRSRSLSADFEDVKIPDEPLPSIPENHMQEEEDEGTESANVLDHQTGSDDAELVEFDDFSDPEDEELLHQLTLEAEEHARFASTLNNKSQAQNVADYETELKQLRNQQKKDRRDADEVTHIMISECQQLLRLFGLPYITAPMEAEAQCAELVKLGLVDGIVTDDSDCFLFGGTRIYKNMFNQAKFVECYLTSDLEKEFDLTRAKLIQVAQLLGSDYTEGLPGVGPVTALEILSEFSTLQDFKNWWSGVQMNTIPKSEDASKPFRKKFRRNATKLFLPPTFPDVRVDLAYQEPEVDSDPEAFQWGVPDLDALRTFLMATIGWSQERTDEVLVPVIRDMNRRADEGTQSNITAFFDGGVGIGTAGATKGSGRFEGFAPRKRVAESSKRMGSALTRMAEKAKRSRDRSTSQDQSVTEGDALESDLAEGQSVSKVKQKKKAAPKRKRKDVVAEEEEDEGDSDPAPRRRKTRVTAE